MKKIILILVCMFLTYSLWAAENLLIMGFDPDRDSRNVLGSIIREFDDIFKNDESFRLIPNKEVENAFKAARIPQSNFESMTPEQISTIAEALNAHFIISGSINKIDNTNFRLSGIMRSRRSSDVQRFSLNLSNNKNQRVATLRNELVPQLKNFAHGEIDKLMDMAILQFQSQQYDSAESQFQRILEIEPQNVDVYFYLGYIQADRHQFQTAVEYYNRGLDIDPENENILIFLAEAYKQQGLIDRAIEAYEQVAQLRTDKAVYYNIALLLKERNRPDEALLELDKALEIDPDYVPAHDMYAEIAYDERLYEQAIEHLEYMTEAKPDDDEYARKLAISYQRTGQLDKAIERYQAIITSDKNNIRAYQNLAAAYRAMALETSSDANRYNRQALGAYQEALRIDPNNAGIEVSIADVYLALNDLTNAERHATAAKAKQANLHEASTILGMIAQRQGIDKYNAYAELQTRSDNAMSENLYGSALDDVIARRDRTKAEANQLFQRADRLFREALSATDNDRARADINQKINGNRNYLDLTK